VYDQKSVQIVSWTNLAKKHTLNPELILDKKSPFKYRRLPVFAAVFYGILDSLKSEF
jgi:hypothetical protein